MRFVLINFLANFGNFFIPKQTLTYFNIEETDWQNNNCSLIKKIGIKKIPGNIISAYTEALSP